MIQLSTLEDVSRSPQKRALRRFRDEQRRALWIGGGSISIPGDPLGAAAGFNGNFATLFPTAYQVLQSDLGLTYGGTLRHTVGTGPVITLTGAISGVPTAITVTCTLAGALGVWQGLVTYGDGTTQAFTSAATVALTGRGAGLTLNIAAGAAVLADVWRATCAGLADQTANAKNSSQATPALQPILTTGLNNKPGLLFDGVDDIMTSTVGTLLAFPYQVLVVARYASIIANAGALVSGDTFAGTIYMPNATQVAQYNGTIANNVTFSGTTPQRFAASFTNSASDSLKVGALATVTGTNAGATVGNTRSIGATMTPGQFANAEIYAVIYTPIVPFAAFDAAINSAAGYGPGAIGV